MQGKWRNPLPDIIWYTSYGTKTCVCLWMQSGPWIHKPRFQALKALSLLGMDSVFLFQSLCCFVFRWSITRKYDISWTPKTWKGQESVTQIFPLMQHNRQPDFAWQIHKCILAWNLLVLFWIPRGCYQRVQTKPPSGCNRIDLHPIRATKLVTPQWQPSWLKCFHGPPLSLGCVWPDQVQVCWKSVWTWFPADLHWGVPEGWGVLDAYARANKTWASRFVWCPGLVTSAFWAGIMAFY